MKFFFLLAGFALSGCTFVALTAGGAGVAQLATGDVANCEQVGVVTSQTRSKVVLKRGAETVQAELIILARNEAALLTANAIVPIAEPEQGSQRFRAYRCS